MLCCLGSGIAIFNTFGANFFYCFYKRKIQPTFYFSFFFQVYSCNCALEPRRDYAEHISSGEGAAENVSERWRISTLSLSRRTVGCTGIVYVSSCMALLPLYT